MGGEGIKGEDLTEAGATLLLAHPLGAGEKGQDAQGGCCAERAGHWGSSLFSRQALQRLLRDRAGLEGAAAPPDYQSWSRAQMQQC